MIIPIDNFEILPTSDISNEFLVSTCEPNKLFEQSSHLERVLKSDMISPRIGELVTIEKLKDRGVFVFVARHVVSKEFFYLIYQMDKLVSTIPYFQASKFKTN